MNDKLIRDIFLSTTGDMKTKKKKENGMIILERLHKQSKKAHYIKEFIDKNNKK